MNPLQSNETEAQPASRQPQHDQPGRLSIVIDNYNYDRFVAEAINSALDQTWPDVEVIVVDDGSTDNSRNIIEGFGDRIVPLFKPNGGQHTAITAGIEQVTGDVTIVLDSDDALHPHVGAQAMKAFAEDSALAKAQWPLQVVDANGTSTGSLNPQPSILVSGDLQEHIIKYRTHAWPPQSGNAYRTRVLRQVAPIPATYAKACDRYYSDIVPLFGPIKSFAEPGGIYRIHGTNMYSGAEVKVERIRSQIDLTLANHEDVKRFCGQLGIRCPSDAREALDVAFACQRLASLRLDPANHPIADDSLLALAIHGVRSAMVHPHHTVAHKLKRIGWIVGVAFAPKATALRLIKRFYFNNPG